MWHWCCCAEVPAPAPTAIPKLEEAVPASPLPRGRYVYCFIRDIGSAAAGQVDVSSPVARDTTPGDATENIDAIAATPVDTIDYQTIGTLGTGTSLRCRFDVPPVAAAAAAAAGTSIDFRACATIPPPPLAWCVLRSLTRPRTSDLSARPPPSKPPPRYLGLVVQARVLDESEVAATASDEARAIATSGRNPFVVSWTLPRPMYSSCTGARGEGTGTWMTVTFTPLLAAL